MFESIRWILDNIFGISGNGFVIRENISPENIETCNGVAVKDERTRTCALCVALNDTVFKMIISLFIIIHSANAKIKNMI